MRSRIIYIFLLLFGYGHSLAQNQTGQSLFDYIYEFNGTPKVHINTDIDRLRDISNDEEYQKAEWTLVDPFGMMLVSMDGRVRTRGNSRKKVCGNPPVKIDFQMDVLDSLGFAKLDKLKFVFSCGEDKSNQQKLYKEFFLYKLFDLISPYGMRVKLIDFTLVNNGKEETKIVGFLVEDEEEYARRHGVQIMARDEIKRMKLEREPFLKMLFFEYMIANTDWAITNMHNIEIVKFPGKDNYTSIPYDFDFSGFVGQSYAKPHSSLPIKSIQDRYFFPFQLSVSEFNEMVEYFLSIEDEVYKLCEKAHYMNPKSIHQNKKYLAGFFDLLRKPKKIRASIKKN